MNPTFVPGMNGFLVPFPALLMPPIPTDSLGQIDRPVPGGGGPLTADIQAVTSVPAVPGSYDASNALRVDLLP